MIQISYKMIFEKMEWRVRCIFIWHISNLQMFSSTKFQQTLPWLNFQQIICQLLQWIEYNKSRNTLFIFDFRNLHTFFTLITQEQRFIVVHFHNNLSGLFCLFTCVNTPQICFSNTLKSGGPETSLLTWVCPLWSSKKSLSVSV